MELIIVLLFIVAAIFIISFIIAIVKAIINIFLLPFRIIGRILSPRKSKTQPIYTSPIKEDKYTTNWSTISRKYKDSRNWTCQKCCVYLGRKEHRRLLQVHHINRNSMDNSSGNLIALCLQCHSAQPGKGHKRLRGAIIKDGRWNEIDRIRKK